jgi:hypothetical protein
MAAKMFRATKGCTAKSVVYSNAAATYGVTQATELAMYFGGNVPNRYIIGNTALNAIALALEVFARRKKPAAPGAGNLLFISMNTQTLGLKSPASPTIANVAGATAVDDNSIGILIGNTFFASADDSAVLMRALEACMNAPVYLTVRKKG